MGSREKLVMKSNEAFALLLMNENTLVNEKTW